MAERFSRRRHNGIERPEHPLNYRKMRQEEGLINYTEETRTVKVAESIECDRCHKNYDADKSSMDVFEVQEFHHIGFTGGYASIFGDETTIECDLCQHCLKELIGDFYRRKD